MIKSYKTPFGELCLIKKHLGIELLTKTHVVSSLTTNGIPAPYVEAAVQYLDPKECDEFLLLGLGGGSFVKRVHQISPKTLIDCVEIDSVMIQIAKDEFGVCRSDKVFIYQESAESFVNRRKVEYAGCFVDLGCFGPVPSFVSDNRFLSNIDKITKGRIVINWCDDLSIGHEVVKFFEKTKREVQIGVVEEHVVCIGER